MGTKTKIEWTEATWNPVRGCSIVSEGCSNCYAMRMAHRSNRPGGAYEGLTRIGAHGPTWTGDVRFVSEALEYPLKLRKPHRIFVNSMSDLFHPLVLDQWIEKIFNVMYAAKQHTFQILTKRPERMLDWISRSAFLSNAPLENVWLGVSAEDQIAANRRIPLLMHTPAAKRWISAEPLLGPINLEPWLCFCPVKHEGEDGGSINCAVDDNYLDWVVAGGESGPGARPMHPDWIRSLKEQCQAGSVPFFFKQWGKFIDRGGCDDPCGRCVIARPDGSITGTNWEAGPLNKGGFQLHPVGKKLAGNLLDGHQHLEYPA